MRNKHASRQSVRGISLIEVLISVTIGLVVLAAVIVSYVGSGKASRYQAALTQMNQDAQIGLNLLSREIQLAGYSAPSALTNTAAAGSTPVFVVSYNLGTVTAPIFGCDVSQSVGTFVDPTAANVVCGNNGATPTFSGLGVIYEADAKNTVPSSAGVPTDCLGATIVAEAGGYYLARNRYFIDKATGANASGRPELFCASNKAGASKQPLLENVEDMQVWYGVGAGGGSRQVIRYAKAGKDATTPNTVNAVGAAEWANVIGVRVCLLMRSAEPILQSGGEDTVRYFDCDAVPHDSADGYLRRAYFTTSTLRSKMAF
jgi:type IV pilus assembly protein PilW